MGMKFELGPWGREVLPDHLKDRKHDDWPYILRWVPRWATAFGGEGPSWPDGIPEGPIRKPIPPPGEQTYHLYDKKGWWRSYYALSFEFAGKIWHLRVGFRWDDVDHYYNLVIPWLATFKVVGKV